MKCESSWFYLLRNYVTMIHGQQNIKFLEYCIFPASKYVSFLCGIQIDSFYARLQNCEERLFPTSWLYVCPPVCPPGTIRLPAEGFS
jgi:hypothetical protein